MEDLEGADSAPVNVTGSPEGNNDPQDPLRPEIEEEDSTRTPPIAEPTMDMETVEDDAAPIDRPGDGDEEDDDDADSDVLSEVDEAQFEDFDANAVAIEERPRVVDADGVAQLGVHKRKRDETDGTAKKKRKEGRREKPKRSKKAHDSDDGFEYGEAVDGKRSRKSKAPGEKRRKARTPSPENDDHLTPEERTYGLQSVIAQCTDFTNRPKEGL